MQKINRTTETIVFTAVFAALCCVATYVIVIPLPYGYFNTGDIFVLLSGWFLGPIYGFIAAAIGSMLADILSGFVFYAPATFLIKGIDAVLAYYIWRLLKAVIKKENLDFLPRAISAFVGELFMVFGYFLFESILYGIVGGTASLLGNALQGVICALVATIIVGILYRITFIKQEFSALYKEEINR